MSGSEQDYIREAFDQNWVAPLGPHVNGLEEDLCAFTQVEAAAVLNSGTAALHLALITLGVKRDDVVICQSLTFAASAFPITYLGAEPVFIDSEPETWNMDPRLLEKALVDCREQGRKVGAIIIVHLYGMPARMDELMGIAAKYNVPVIEDAAEALGATYKGKPCGGIGTVGILSFNGNKIITTSGGGALLSNHKQLVDKVRFLSTQARDPFPWYEHSETGYNYRMSNIAAGIGRGQMTVITERVTQRRRIYEYYRGALSGIPGFSFLPEPEGHHSNRWLTTLLVEETLSHVSPEAIRLHLEEHNIESRPLWKPLHQQPVFAAATSYQNGLSDALFRNGLCLPSGSALKEKDLEMICTLIKKSTREK